MKIFIEIDEKYLKDVKAVIEGGKDVEPEKAGKKSPAKETKKAATKKEAESAEDAGGEDYESMKAADLYKLCCDRGISSQCKKRDKASLIAVLKANEGKAKEEEADDDWGDDEESDPYAGKSAKELYKMCQDRGILVKPKQAPEVYANKLKEDDAKEEEPEEDGGDDDDDWEV